jgi:hypothetical protein
MDNPDEIIQKKFIKEDHETNIEVIKIDGSKINSDNILVLKTYNISGNIVQYDTYHDGITIQKTSVSNYIYYEYQYDQP